MKGFLIMNKYINQRVTFILVFLSSVVAWGAVPSKLPQLNSRVFTGGEAKQFLSLIEVDWIPAQKSMPEKLRLYWGDSGLQPWNGKPGYFHIEFKEAQRKAIIELTRTLNTSVDQKRVVNTLSKSQIIKDFRIEFDRISQSMFIHIGFKKDVNLGAVTGKSTTGSYLGLEFKSTTR